MSLICSAAGVSVKEVSFSIGHKESHAFVALFRETFGTTPRVWMSALRSPG
jgi:AraC-like DNA-binding protein